MTRTPPKIIFVPPPEGPRVPGKRIRTIAGACIIGTSASLVLFVARGMSVWVGALAMAPVLLVVAILVTLRRWQLNRAHETLRRAFLAKHPADETDPLVAAFSRAWKEVDRVPKLTDVREALRPVENRSHVVEDRFRLVEDRPQGNSAGQRAPRGTAGDSSHTRSGDEPGTGRATIICFGEADVPEVGELRFEPEIVTPTGAVWRQLMWLAIAGVPVAWCLLDWLRLLPAWLPGARALFGGFAYFLVAGAIALAVWVWRAMIRPTYLRMAPGVIQVLQYGFSRAKPTIRGYPMEAGTLAFFTRIRKRLTLTLSRGEQQDVIDFSRMRDPKQRLERTWQALLSTAPTPPLSDEELVG